LHFESLIRLGLLSTLRTSRCFSSESGSFTLLHNHQVVCEMSGSSRQKAVAGTDDVRLLYTAPSRIATKPSRPRTVPRSEISATPRPAMRPAEMPRPMFRHVRGDRDARG
jgi:hypothetical protein